jgi:hypothetical protein
MLRDRDAGDVVVHVQPPVAWDMSGRTDICVLGLRPSVGGSEQSDCRLFCRRYKKSGCINPLDLTITLAAALLQVSCVDAKVIQSG